MLSKDFEAGTDVVKRKIKQVRALNHVVKTMRGKIQDLDLDPVELKVDRNHWRHEAKALKLQVAKLKEDRDHWDHQANFFRLERDELKVRLEELENNKPNNADEGYDDDVSFFLSQCNWNAFFVILLQSLLSHARFFNNFHSIDVVVLKLEHLKSNENG